MSRGTTPPLPGLPDEYTIEFRVRTDGSLHGVLLSTVAGDPPNGWDFFHEEGEWTAFDNVLVFIDYDTPNWFYVVDPELDLNDMPGWRHVAVTKDAAGLVRLFVDGEPVAELDFMTPFAVVDRPLSIGSDPAGGIPLFGAAIDDLRISSVVRYGARFGAPPELVADASTIYLWRFDEGSGSQAIDEVGGVVFDLVAPIWIEE